jgi:hypothetical protein
LASLFSLFAKGGWNPCTAGIFQSIFKAINTSGADSGFLLAEWGGRYNNPGHDLTTQKSFDMALTDTVD